MSTYNNLVVLGFLLIAASGIVDASNYPRGITKQDQQMEAQLIMNNAVNAAKQELAAVEKAIDLIYENKNNNKNEIMFGKSTEISSKETATDNNNNLQCVVAGGPCTIFYQDGCCSGLCYPVFWLLIGICQ